MRFRLAPRSMTLDELP